jgi:integrase
MPSIVEREGRFLARVRRDGFRPVSKTFPRKSDAIAWGRRVEADMIAGRWVEVGAALPSFQEVLREYRQHVVPTLKGADSYKWALDDAAAQPFASKPINEVTAADLSRWRDAMAARGLVAGTIVRRLGLVSGLFTWAWKERGWLSANPLAGVRKPRVSDARDRVLTADEQRHLLASASSGRNPWLGDALVVLLQTAVRRSELWGLSVSDLDLKASVLKLRDGKTGARVVPCSPAACEALQRLALAAGARGAKERQAGRTDAPAVGEERLIPLSDAPALSLAFKRAVTRAQTAYLAECVTTGTAPAAGFLEGVRLHDLRHTSVTAWAATGALSVHELQLVSGHKTVAMLSRYVNLKPSDLAAKLGKLDLPCAAASPEAAGWEVTREFLAT